MIWVEDMLERFDWQLELRPDPWNCALCGRSNWKVYWDSIGRYHPRRMCNLRVRGEGQGWWGLQESQHLKGSWSFEELRKNLMRDGREVGGKAVRE